MADLSHPLHDACSIGDEVAVREMLAASPGLVDTLDADQQTSLHVSVDENHLGVARQLIQAGADPNRARPAGSGERPLISAIIHPVYQDEMVVLLLEAGADPDMVDNYGYRPLERAILSSREGAVKLLLEKGAQVQFYSSRQDEEPLLAAIGFASDSIAALLLSHGALHDPTGPKAQEALALASGRGFFKTVKILVGGGVGLDAYLEPKGTTALMRAVEGDHLALAQYLVQAGARVELTPRHDPHVSLADMAGPRCKAWLSSLDAHRALETQTPQVPTTPRARL